MPPHSNAGPAAADAAKMRDPSLSTNLRVRAEIDEQRRRTDPVEADRDGRRDGIGSHMTFHARKHVDGCRRVSRQFDVPGAQGCRGGPLPGVGRDAQAPRVRASPEVQHGRVADDDSPGEIPHRRSGLECEAQRQRRDGTTDRRGQRLPVPDVQARGVDPRHHVAAEFGLRVDGRACRLEIAGLEVDDRRREAGGADVDRQSKRSPAGP